ncbi:MAG: SGNH/GDSL hydrolase family protein [Candidatus Thiodiazotropha sp.]
MDDICVSKFGDNNGKNENFSWKTEISDIFPNDSASRDDSKLSWNSESDISNGSLVYNDQFEGIFYRTYTSESKISIQFVSGVFFETFKNKIHADYMSSADIDNTNFVSKCTTHIKGAKCDLKLDSHFKTVELSGIGSKIWREERFPKIAQFLFKRLLQDLDSQLEGSTQDESMPEDKTELCYQQNEPKWEAETSYTTDVSDASNCNVALNCHVASGGNVGLKSSTAEPNTPKDANSESTCLASLASVPTADGVATDEAATTANLETEGGFSFTAEKITYPYQHGGNLTSAAEVDSNSLQHKPVAVNYGNKPTSVNYGNFLGHRLNLNQTNTLSEDGLTLISQERIACGSGTRPMSVFTSTPIMQRQEDTDISGAASQNICAIISKIDQLDSGLKALKRDILQQMECKLNELKSSVLNMIENLVPSMSYADVTKKNASVQLLDMTTSENLSVSSFTDEGYGDHSEVNVQRDSSQTQLKTLDTDKERQPVTNSTSCPVSVPVHVTNTDNNRQPRNISTGRPVPRNIPAPRPVPVHMTNRNNERQPSNVSTPRPVPVHMTNRNSPVQRQSARCTFNTILQENQVSSVRQERTLIIGDSILKGVNFRGLKKGVTICTRRGATINDLWDELAVYDMKSFAQIIICVGGNDCSSGVNIQTFEEKYDQLISFIKSENGDCAIYLSKVLPRGDINVEDFNFSIQRVADYWAMHRVKCIEDTYSLFFGKNGLPCGRYFYKDGIHLSYSGTKRLIDALNRYVDIVSDFQLCVFQRPNLLRKGMVAPVTRNKRNYGQSVDGNRENGFNIFNKHRQNNRRCYGCSMPGHILAECWNVH